MEQADLLVCHAAQLATVGGSPYAANRLNINLGTSNVTVAKAIARSIRSSSGGFPSIKALGVLIENLHLAQVTINVCNYQEVPLPRVFETVRSEAVRYGVQIIDLLPLEALLEVAPLLPAAGDQVLGQRLQRQ